MIEKKTIFLIYLILATISEAILFAGVILFGYTY